MMSAHMCLVHAIWMPRKEDLAPVLAAIDSEDLFTSY